MAPVEDDLIGLTEFSYKGEGVRISVFKPQKKWEGSDEFSCRFSILGGEISYSAETIGFDSNQSLILALASVGQYLNDVELDQEEIHWPGGKLQFPSFRSLV